MKINNKIIAISGKSGCGNTTVSEAIAEKLNYTFINYTFRQLAEKYSIPFEEMLELSRKDPKFDIELDDENVRVAREGQVVVGTRLAIWLLKEEAITIYINASLDKRTNNILTRETGTYDEIHNFTRKRDEDDHNRFMKIYNIDNDDYEFADIVVEADDKDADQVIEEILDRLKQFTIGRTL